MTIKQKICYFCKLCNGNSAGNKVYYVEPASSAFDAQSAEIKELQMQMATLGISTLSQQKFVAESADARRVRSC